VKRFILSGVAALFRRPSSGRAATKSKNLSRFCVGPVAQVVPPFLGGRPEAFPRVGGLALWLAAFYGERSESAAIDGRFNYPE
jgi:hypothetical protein